MNFCFVIRALSFHLRTLHVAAGLAAVIALVKGTQIRKEVTMNILIVEDDPVIADVIGMTLEEAGHFSTVAHTI